MRKLILSLAIIATAVMPRVINAQNAIELVPIITFTVPANPENYTTTERIFMPTREEEQDLAKAKQEIKLYESKGVLTAGEKTLLANAHDVVDEAEETKKKNTFKILFVPEDKTPDRKRKAKKKVFDLGKGGKVIVDGTFVLVPGEVLVVVPAEEEMKKALKRCGKNKELRAQVRKAFENAYVWVGFKLAPAKGTPEYTAYDY